MDRVVNAVRTALAFVALASLFWWLVGPRDESNRQDLRYQEDDSNV